MLIMEIKFKRLLFTVQKRTIRYLEIAIFWIEDYKHFPSSMSAIRSIIVVLVLFCWKTSKKFLLTFERKKKAGLRQFLKIKKCLKVTTP